MSEVASLTRIFEEKFKVNPLNTIVPSYTIKDPLEILTLYEPILQDVVKVCENLICAMPNLGSIGNTFSIFNEKSSEVSIDSLNSKLDEFKTELIKLINENIEGENEIKKQIELCQETFTGFKSSLSTLMQELIALKKKLTNKEQPKKNDLLYSKFNTLIGQLESLLKLYSNPNYIKHIYKKYVELLSVYSLLMVNLNAFWYQYGINSNYVIGVDSFREKSHNNIYRGLNNLKTIGEFISTKELEQLYRLLESDLQLYPVPLYKSPIEIPFNDYVHDIARAKSFTPPICNIKTTEIKTPFIYRIDAVNCSGEGMIEYKSGHARKIPKRDPMTDCQGFYFSTCPRIRVLLDAKKTCRVRLFGVYQIKNGVGITVRHEQDYNHCNFYQTPDEEAGIIYKVGTSFKSSKPDIANGATNINTSSSSIKNNPKQFESGFVQTEKFYNVSTLDILVDGAGKSKLLFLEVIISDDIEPIKK